MSAGKSGFPAMCVGIAKAILRDRAARRRVLAQMLMVALGLMAIGLWVLGAWLQESVIRFALWWGACALITVVVMLFALYDALAVVREERENIDRD
jgi:uncharacterized membrane protein